MNTKVRVFFNASMRIAILAVSILFLWIQFGNKFQSGSFYDELTNAFSNNDFVVYGLIACLLMPLNWALEIWKWRFLTNSFSNTPISASVRGVISGITISMFLPNRIGDVAGKVLWLKKDLRWKGFFANIFASLSQIIATLVLASAGLVFFYSKFDATFTEIRLSVPVLAGTIFATIISFLLYFKLEILTKILSAFKSPKLKFISSHSEIIGDFNFSGKLFLLFLSFLRLMVYSFQFYFLLIAFGCEIELTEGIMLIAIIYLLITVIPQFAISEIATRSAVTLAIVNLFISAGGTISAAPETPLLLSASLLWIINLFIPAITGLFMLPTLKLPQTERI
jgi:hypothetical protein